MRKIIIFALLVIQVLISCKQKLTPIEEFSLKLEKNGKISRARSSIAINKQEEEYFWTNGVANVFLIICDKFPQNCPKNHKKSLLKKLYNVCNTLPPPYRPPCQKEYHLFKKQRLQQIRR